MRPPRIPAGRRRGAALIEYGLLIAGVALMVAAAVAVFGHKTNDLLAASAAGLPGAVSGRNASILSARVLETTDAGDGVIEMDTEAILDATNTPRLETNLGVPGFDQGLVVEPGS